MLSLKPAHLKRYKDIVVLLLKHGRSDWVESAGLTAALGEEPFTEDVGSKAEDLANELEEMGPTFVKLGQLLSTRADLLPPPYLDALARLQDDVDPFPYEEVEKAVQEELGVRISKAFDTFDPEPLAAASLGQVHRATLRDGRPVVVKIQRPGIRPQVAEDLEALNEIAELLDRHTETGRTVGFVGLVEEFRRTLLQELDYRVEAANLATLGENLAEFERVVVPLAVEDYTSSRVLTMEYIRGTKIDALSPVVRAELDGNALADELFRAYLAQVLRDGFFHADPHPGNVFLTEDRRIALLDLGMVGRVERSLQEPLLKLLLAVAEGAGDEAATRALEMSEIRREVYDESGFRREVTDLVSRAQQVTLDELNVGRVVLEVCRAAVENGVRPAPALSLLGKTLLNLDKIGHCLAPDFDPNAAIRESAGELLSQRMKRDTTPGQMMAALLETKELVTELPRRANQLLDILARNELRLTVDAIDEHALIVAMQKIANRISAGLVLAALIVGAALMMRVETSFTVFGYPGLAMLCFIAAAAGGFWMVWNVMWKDRERKRG